MKLVVAKYAELLCGVCRERGVGGSVLIILLISTVLERVFLWQRHLFLFGLCSV